VIATLRRWLSPGARLPYEPGPDSIPRTPQAQKNRGIHAATILADPLIAEALAAIERRAQEAWSNSAASEHQMREQAYWRLKAAAGFRAELEGIIRDGKVAEDEIDSNERLAERRRQQEHP
jgi:hypothetical protein